MDAVDIPRLFDKRRGRKTILDARVAHTADPHHDENVGDVARTDVVSHKKTQQQLVICCGSHVKAKAAILLVQRAPTKECGMRRHPASEEQFVVIWAGHPVALDFGSVVAGDTDQVTVACVQFSIPKLICNYGQDAVMWIKVIGIQNTYDVTLGSSQPLVQGIVHSSVRL